MTLTTKNYLDLWIRVLLNEKPKEIITKQQLKEVFGIKI